MLNIKRSLAICEPPQTEGRAKGLQVSHTHTQFTHHKHRLATTLLLCLPIHHHLPLTQGVQMSIGFLSQFIQSSKG